MFSVKATYNGEIRRISFPGLITFPTFDQLTSQLLRVFPSLKGYCLSRLLFSPDSRNPARILVSREVRTSDDYHRCILQFSGRSWPNASLRFSLLDVAAETGSQQAPGQPAEQTTSQVTPITPPPTIPLPPLFSLGHSSDCSPNTKSQPESSPTIQETSNAEECCAVTQVKAEITTLLRTFQEDLDRNLSRVFTADIVDETNEPTLTSNSSATNSVISACPVCGTLVAGRPCVKCSVSICSECGIHAGTSVCNVSSSDPCSTTTVQPNFSSAPPLGNQPLQPLAAPAMPSSTNVLSSPYVAGGVALTDAPSPVIHYNTICDDCLSTITGIRHKCLDCPDFDLCTRCLNTGSVERHNHHHKFIEITQPGQVIVHTVYEDREGTSHEPAESTPNEPTQTSRAAHNATCDLCDSLISGFRYKCSICPDFDTCDLCFTITAEQHPNHSFVRLSKPEDYIPRDEPLRPRHFAKCDVCNKFISGIRYKCMHPQCPDYDLCERCEAFPIPQHPDNHPMLKMKSTDTVIPTVYRVGQTSIIPIPENQPFVPVREPTSSNNPSPLSWEERLISTLSPMLRETSRASSSPYGGGSIASETNIGTPQLVSPFSPLVTQSKLPPIVPIECVPLPVRSRLSSHLDNDISLAQDIRSTSSSAGYLPERRIAPDQLNASSGNDSSPLLPASVDFGFYNIGRSNFNPVQASDEQTTANNPPPNCPSSLIGTPSERVLSRSPAPHSLEYPPTRKLSLADLLEKPRSLSGLCLNESAVNIPPSPFNFTGEPLSANFVEDVTLPDGLALAPSVTFVKAWRMANNGAREWPSTTRVVFVGGVPLAVGQFNHNAVQAVLPGQEAVVYSCELKAPDTPGKYSSYWRLQDDQGQLFGDTLWINIQVVDASHALLAQSLASSSIMMPDPTSPDRLSPAASDKSTRSSSPTNFTEEILDDGVSDTSSISMISASSSDSDDALWADSRANAPSRPAFIDSPQSPEYVVLYDDNTSEEAE